VWLPRWPITVWRRRSAAPPEGPAALVIAERGVRKLHAVNAAAGAAGLFLGQKAADAGALVPGLVLDEADPAGDDAALERLVDACCRFSPAVAKDAPDGLFLDIDGVAHLWGGEEGLLEDLLARLASQGVEARAAIADTAGAAWAMARFGDAPLSSLPIAALRLDPQDAAQLLRLGITKIAQLKDLPRAGLTKRFGKMALMRLDQALGTYPEALAYRRPPTPWFERLCLVEPVSTPEDIARIAADLAGLMCERLAMSERAARRFEIAFHRVDGQVARIALGLSRPGREAKILTRLIARKLEGVDPGFGIEAATIVAWEVEIRRAAQTALAETQTEKDGAAVGALIDSLSNRLGAHRVWRARAHQSHVPERAVLRAPAGEAPGPGWDPDLPRPLRLFRRPEPVEVMALLPDDPPVQFRWRGRLHRVRLSEGPERIGDEWWRRAIETVSTGRLRDYYRVEDETGGRYWLFRSGLEGGRWWLHGVF